MTVTGAVAIRRVVSSPLAENGYVVSCGRDAVIVDPGGGADEIVQYVGANALEVHAVLNTHGHDDHLVAAAELIDAYRVPFAIHSSESRVLRRANFYRLAIHRQGPIAVPDVAIDLADVTCLRFGALEVAVKHTPGHSPGSVCLGMGGSLLTGDTLMVDRSGMSELPESNHAALEASVRGLARDYPPQTAIHPGHGDSGRLGDAVEVALRALAA